MTVLLRGRRAGVGAIIVVLLISAPVASAGAERAPSVADSIRPADLVPHIVWSMPDRFGVDRDRDGIVDLPNSPAYVAGSVAADCVPSCPPPEFPVRLTASLGGSSLVDWYPLVEYRWTLEHEDGTVEQALRYVPEMVTALPEGSHRISLKVVLRAPFRAFGVTTATQIRVEDVLIVAMGDSYASGEGNPERHLGETRGEAMWGDAPGDPVATREHAAARRSSLAWPAQVAMDLERADDRSSVTFVSLAASGATVAEGLLGPQNQALPSGQVEAAADLVGNRDVDILLLSIGGNDVGFSRVVAGLVAADPWFDPVCYETDLESLWMSVTDGQWDRTSHLTWAWTDPLRLGCRTDRSPGGTRLPGLDGLPDELDRVAAALATGLRPAVVVVTAYPDPTGYSDGGGGILCDEIVGDAAPLGLHEISREEQVLGKRYVLDPLNDALAAAAGRHGWSFIDGVTPAFLAGHGYCAAWPDYRLPDPPGGTTGALEHPEWWYRNGNLAGTQALSGPVTWYRTAAQSVVLQGPGSAIDTTGTMHPNELGHRAIADLVLEALGD